MRVSEVTCVKNVKCNECGRLLKANINSRYGIIPNHTKSGILLCRDCFADLKKVISEMQCLKIEE